MVTIGNKSVHLPYVFAGSNVPWPRQAVRDRIKITNHEVLFAVRHFASAMATACRPLSTPEP